MTLPDDHLDAHLADLAGHTGPDPGTLNRLRRQLRPSASTQEGSLSLPRWVHVATLGVAAAAALLVVTRLAVPHGNPGSISLQALTTSYLQASANVALQFVGEGSIQSNAKSHDIWWELGHLDIDVVPNTGVILIVGTPEATVNVVGTHFTVERGPLGTEVTVDRGQVDLSCRGGVTAPLTDGGRMCPRRASDLYAQAVALQVRGDAPEATLEMIGLALSQNPDLLAYELLALRTSVLSELGRTDDLQQTLRAYVDGGGGIRQAEFKEWLDALERGDPRPPR